jgi:hypothetical protein
MRLFWLFLAQSTVPPSPAIIKRIDSRGQSVLQIAQLGVKTRLAVEPTSHDEIQRSVVAGEPTSSILAMGRSIIVAA